MSRDDLSSMLVSLLELPDEGRDERAVHAVACSHYVKCCKLRLDSQEISHKHRNRHEPATKKSFTINLPSTGLGGHVTRNKLIQLMMSKNMQHLAQTHVINTDTI